MCALLWKHWKIAIKKENIPNFDLKYCLSTAGSDEVILKIHSKESEPLDERPKYITSLKWTPNEEFWMSYSGRI